MKKARIMLSAFALVAIVGGAFAFKASNFGSVTVYTSVAGTCPADLGLYKKGTGLTFPNATTIAASASNNICASSITVAAE